MNYKNHVYETEDTSETLNQAVDGKRIFNCSHSYLLEFDDNFHIPIQNTDIAYMGIMCPRCLFTDVVQTQQLPSIEKNSILSSTEIRIAQDVTYSGKCPCCKRENYFIEIDVNILYAIKEFNRKGYATKFCCEGHLGTDKNIDEDDVVRDGYVYFDTNSILDHMHTLPLSWYLDVEDFKSGFGHIIRYDVESNDKGLAMHELLQWAKSLPLRNPRIRR